MYVRLENYVSPEKSHCLHEYFSTLTGFLLQDFHTVIVSRMKFNWRNWSSLKFLQRTLSMIQCGRTEDLCVKTQVMGLINSCFIFGGLNPLYHSSRSICSLFVCSSFLFLSTVLKPQKINKKDGRQRRRMRQGTGEIYGPQLQSVFDPSQILVGPCTFGSSRTRKYKLVENPLVGLRSEQSFGSFIIPTVFLCKKHQKTLQESRPPERVLGLLRFRPTSLSVLSQYTLNS